MPMAEIKKITLSNLLRELKQKEDIEKAKILARFFKTGPGQYGEGDLFLGITVPESRKIALRYSDLPFSDISKLIKNKYHEARLVALLILVHKYKSSQISQIKGLPVIILKELINRINGTLYSLPISRIPRPFP